jgi:hypothetical protein
MMGIASSLPIHMTRMNTHFEMPGMPGETYPVKRPQELGAETISKSRLVPGGEIR